MPRGPRDSDTTPDCASSRIPYGSSTRINASSFAGVPVASIVNESVVTSTTLARNRFTASMTWLRVVASVRTLIKASSRDTALSSSCSTILITLMSLLSCLVICSSGESSTLTTMVIRDMSFCSVAPTASDWILNPRRENSDATRASTPGLSSTSTLNVCVLTVVMPRLPVARPSLRSSLALVFGCSCVSLFWIVEQRADSLCRLDFVVAGARGDHRPHLGVGADDEVDHHRTVVDLAGLLDDGLDVFCALATQSDAAQGLGKLDEVRNAMRMRGEIGLAVTLFVEQRLPLPHHAEVAVVDDGHFDGRALDGTGGQFLVGHLEAAVAVDGPHLGLGTAELGAHRRRNREAHGAQTARVQPGLRVLVFDELRRPHLVLAHTGNVDGVGTRHLAECFDDVLRRQASVTLRPVAQRVGRLHAAQVLPPVVDLGRTDGAVSAQRLDQVGDHGLDVADDRHVGVAVLADLGRVDVGVDDLGLWRKGIQLAR